MKKSFSVTNTLEPPLFDAQKSLSGTSSKTDSAYLPDYTIKAITDVLYLKVKISDYSSALKASLMGKKASHTLIETESELEKLLDNGTENDEGFKMNPEEIPLQKLSYISNFQGLVT